MKYPDKYHIQPITVAKTFDAILGGQNYNKKSNLRVNKRKQTAISDVLCEMAKRRFCVSEARCWIKRVPAQGWRGCLDD